MLRRGDELSGSSHLSSSLKIDKDVRYPIEELEDTYDNDLNVKRLK